MRRSKRVHCEGSVIEVPDGKPASDVLVVLAPKLATEEHIRILAETTRMFADRDFRERLR